MDTFEKSLSSLKQSQNASDQKQSGVLHGYQGYNLLEAHLFMLQIAMASSALIRVGLSNCSWHLKRD